MLREKEGAEDVYHYHDMSMGLRTQLIILIRKLVGLRYASLDEDSAYKSVISQMRLEKQVFKLAERGHYSSSQNETEFENWFLYESDLDHLLSGLEMMLYLCLKSGIYSDGSKRRGEIIEDINAYMLEGGFGFQFENGIIIEIGSTFIHKEVVVPVLGLLSDPQYKTVNNEFRKAHEEFRKGDYEDCIHDCCNAFESMMKIISAKHGWVEITDKSTVKDLVKAIFDHNFIPSYMQQEFTGLRTILEGGINTVRNKAGGHGQGATPRVIDKQVAEFQLNQSAAALKMLAEYNK